MFSYTREAIGKTVVDIRRALLLVNIAAQLFYIGYLIYAIATSSGIQFINITLLSISTLYFAFYLTTRGMKNRADKYMRRATRHTYKWVKISLSSITLINTVYGVYIAAGQSNPITIILATLSIIAWILQITFEFIAIFFESHMYMILDAASADKDRLMAPARVAGDFVKNVASKVSSASTTNSVRNFFSKISDRQTRSYDDENDE